MIEILAMNHVKVGKRTAGTDQPRVLASGQWKAPVKHFGVPQC
jgi:hypothetical protein